jgi:hypothetical protein
MEPNERIAFYDNNPSAKEELLNWFKLNDNNNIKGLRCMALRPEDRRYRYAYRNINSKYAYALTPLTEELFNKTVRFARTVEFFPWIFDEGILKCMRKANVNEHRIGITMVIDIDAPDKNEDDKSIGRQDLLQEDCKYLEIMDNVLGVFKDELNKVDLWNESKMTFTGNGINIVLSPYYDNMIELMKYANGVKGLIKDVTKMVKYPFVHAKLPGWNSNFKPPKTFHFERNRLTLEIPDINRKLDLDWLIQQSNPYNDKVYVQCIQ